jgi:hypothetical protein
MDDMIRNALAYLGVQAKKGVRADERISRIADTITDEQFLVVNEDGKHEIISVPKTAAPSPVRLRVISLKGFTDFLNSPEAEKDIDTTMVLVGDSEIVAHLDWHDERNLSEVPLANAVRRDVRLSLEYCEEFEELCALRGPHNQKVFAQSLLTILPDNIAKALALQTMSLNWKYQEDRKIDINQVGLVSSESTEKVVITSGGDNVELQVEWNYDGPVFACALDFNYLVRLRLEVSTKDGEIFFQLHPKQISKTKQNARQDIIDKLQDGVTQVVIEGHRYYADSY